MTPFQRIYETIISKAPQLAAKSTHCVNEWLASGYDLEKEIIPAIEDSLKKGSHSIYSFGFFTSGIKRMNESRIKAVNKPVAHTKEEVDSLRAKNIKWHKVRGLCTLQVGPQDYEWLDQYEQKHGEVQV